MTKRIVLASTSPRRREMLAMLRIDVEVRPSNVSEDARAGEPPLELASRLACEKAVAISTQAPDTFVIGADTIVVVDGQVLGKPEDDAEAASMLRRLAGRWHEVVTAVALVCDGSVLEVIAPATRVLFRAMDEETIRRYVASGDGRDKAGAYGVQGIAAGLVERIDGSYTNVVGLPAAETILLLERHGAIGPWP